MQTEKLSLIVVEALIEEAKDEAGLWGFDWKDQYCGRGMGNKKCFGVIPSNHDDFLEYADSVAYGFAVTQMKESDDEVNADLESSIKTKLIDSVKTDSMGLDTIYYWDWMLIG